MAFIDDLDAFTQALGVENAPTIVHLALVPWPDADTRNDFIAKLTNIDLRYEDAIE